MDVDLPTSWMEFIWKLDAFWVNIPLIILYLIHGYQASRANA